MMDLDRAIFYDGFGAYARWESDAKGCVEALCICASPAANLRRCSPAIRPLPELYSSQKFLYSTSVYPSGGDGRSLPRRAVSTSLGSPKVTTLKVYSSEFIVIGS